MIIESNKTYVDVNDYNLINPNNEVKRNYNIDPSNRRIAYNLKGSKLLIVGFADNNYIYWASITRYDDKQANEAIFNHIAKLGYEHVSQEYLILKDINWSFDSYKRSYVDDYPVNGRGDYFANVMSRLPAILEGKCIGREAMGAYLNVLNKYQDILFGNYKDEYEAYYTAQPYIKILESERYLYFSKNDEIRNLYITLRNRGAELYNQYMNVAR